MKLFLIIYRISLASMVAMGFAGSSKAANQYFDVDPTTAALEGGSGIWSEVKWKLSVTATNAVSWTNNNAACLQPTNALSLNVSGTYTVSNLYASGGPVTLSNGTLNVGAGGANINSLTSGSRLDGIVLTANQTWLFSGVWDRILYGTINLGANALTINAGNGRGKLCADLAGSGNLNYIMTGRGDLGGDNSGFTGRLSINGGELVMGSSAALGASNLVVLAGANTNEALVLYGRDLTIGGLSGGGGKANVSNGPFDHRNAYTGPAILTISNNVDYEFAGMIIHDRAGRSQALSLVKAGSGTQTLIGTNLYTGPTTVREGALGCRGILASPVTVAPGAGFSPGGAGGVGDCRINSNLTMAAGSQLNIDYDTTNRDALTVTGTLSIPSNMTVNVTTLGGAGVVDSLVLSVYGTVVAPADLSGWVFPGHPTFSARVDPSNHCILAVNDHLKVYNQPAVAVGLTCADVSGNLAVESPAGASLWLCYGTNDALNDFGGWQTNVYFGPAQTSGVYATTLTSLLPDTRYAYRFFADDGVTNVSASMSREFSTAFLPGVTPSNFVAMNSYDQNILRWTESFCSEDGFVVQRSTHTDFSEGVLAWTINGQDLAGSVDDAAVNGVTYYYRVAASNDAGLSAWSDPETAVSSPSTVVVTNLTLTKCGVFDLPELSRKMAARGTRQADIRATIGGIDVPLATTNAFVDYGMPTNSAWYSDPYGTYWPTTEYRQSYKWSFDCGNGVTNELDLVPVHMSGGSGGSYQDNILLNTAYAGELTIGGTNYLIEVLQGASPLFKERLDYPGYFNGPAVNVMLYDKATTNLVAGIGRLKRLGGEWYAFESNARGEALDVKRIDAVGRLTVDVGTWFTNDFAFTAASCDQSNGWRIKLEDLDFSSKSVIIPSGTYSFSELYVCNAARNYYYLWVDSINGRGSITVPAGGECVMKFGRKASVEVSIDPDTDNDGLYTLYDSEFTHFRMFDADMGGILMPLDEDAVVRSYKNSRGASIVTKWKLHLCGWIGLYDNYTTGEYRDFNLGYNILGTDTNPPAVFDARTITIGADMKGFYGLVSTNIVINARNETYALHGKFYTFNAPLDGFPDLEGRLPDVELSKAYLSSNAVTAAWPGLPAGMTNVFAAQYDFFFDASTAGSGTASWIFYLTSQGAARLYMDDQLILENVNPDAKVTVFSPTLPILVGSRHRMRMVYYHNAGPAALTLNATAFIPPYYSDGRQFDPALPYFRAINYADLPLTVSATGPTQTVYMAPATFTVQVSGTHPDGIGQVEAYVNGVRVAQGSNVCCSLQFTNVPVNAKVNVRAMDRFGCGRSTNLAVTVNRETLEQWLARNNLAGDPDGDTDGDGVRNQDEYVMDTCPTNRESVFAIKEIRACGASNCVVWTGASSSLAMDHYELLATSDLTCTNPPGGWVPVVSAIPVGASGSNAWWYTAAQSNLCYRVRVIPR